MSICDCTYLSDEQVKGFDNYKYCSVDTSPLSVYVSHPFWNQVVKLVPKRVAPNVLTIAGFGFVMLSFGVVSYYDYYLVGASDDFPDYDPVPNWVWLFCCICTFLGHTLDGIDGKQARRTGTAGPTGEMFDHGLDSWATVAFTVTIFSIFGRSDYSVSATRLLGIVMSVQTVFIATHWEKYNTGVLFLSWGYDVSQYGLALLYLFTYFVGFRFFKRTVIPALGINFAEVFEIGFCCKLVILAAQFEVLEFGFYCMCLISIVMTIYNIRHSYVVEKTGRVDSFYEGVLPLTSTVLLFVITLLWALLSPTKVIDQDPRAFIWTMAVLFSNIACRLIVAQMSHTRCEIVNWLLWPYAASFVLSVSVGLSIWELRLVRALAVLFTVAHIHYGACVVRQLCSHFGINAFTVGERTNKNQRAQPTDAGAEERLLAAEQV